MKVAQYIGARYVPKFFDGGVDAAWMAGVEYEPLTIVTWASNSYTSKKPVPATVGNPAANPDYWVQTGSYNAQIVDLTNRVSAIENEMAYNYDTVADLLDSAAEPGSGIHTFGYSAYGDGGNANWYVSAEAPSTGYYLEMDSGYYAVLLPDDGFYNMKAFGAVGNGIADDTAAIQACINAAVDSKYNIYIPAGEYIFTDVVTIPANPNGMIIRGQGKFKTILRANSNSAKIYCPNELMRYDISEITFQGIGSSNEPLIDIVGTAHLSVFHDCVIVAARGVDIKRAGYITFQDCSFRKIVGNICHFLFKVKNEYCSLIRCYFEGSNETSADTAVIVDSMNNFYMQYCDICNFSGGIGLLFNPDNIIKDAVVKDTTFYRCKYNIDFNCNHSIYHTILENIYLFTIDDILDKVIRAYRDTGNGAVCDVKGSIYIDGNFTSGNQLFDFGGWYRGQNVITVAISADYRSFDYAAGDPIMPVMVQINSAAVANQSNTDTVDVRIAQTASFKSWNLPKCVYEVLNGSTPQSVTPVMSGGSLYLRFKYASVLATAFTSINYRLVY